MYDIFRYDKEDFYPANQPRILRNLTTKEYVGSEETSIKPDQIAGGTSTDGLDFFGEVVLSRICWSSPYSDFCGIFREIWAGHKFDITTISQHQESLSDEILWKDVSAEVRAEIAEIREGLLA